MTPAAIALFVFCAALIGFFVLVAWGLGTAAAEDLERSRENRRGERQPLSAAARRRASR